MSIATIFEIVLAAVVLGLGIWTIAVRETYSATVGFVAYGLLVALIWVRLDAVDVALTEAAIGGGLGGVLLLGAAARLRDTEPMVAEAPGMVTRVSAAALSALTAAALAGAVAVPARSCTNPRPDSRCACLGDKSGQPRHQRAHGIPRDGHHA